MSEMEAQNTKNIGKLFDEVKGLSVDMATLKSIVENGFEGTHARQDVANGRMGKLEDRATDLEAIANSNTLRLNGLDQIHESDKQILAGQKRDRKWLKREMITTLLSVTAVILQAILLFILGFGG